MANPKVTIGGEVVKSKGVEAIKDLTENRTMIVQQLTQSPPSKPEIAENLKCIEDVFEHFKPKAEVAFRDKEGSKVAEELPFNSIADFSLKGLTQNSSFLSGLQIQAQTYQQILQELKGNNRLKKLLATEQGKEVLVKTLLALVKELEENESK
ncbi:MAG TPA: hypothetical protein PKG48_03865 [Bacteroidales bacterium]|nr:hypothetical protein [Bacteroidales bacterium]